MKIKNFFKGKFVIISVALITFIVGGVGGFFIGQNRNSSQQTNFTQRMSERFGSNSNGMFGDGNNQGTDNNGNSVYGNSNSQLGGSDANTGATTSGNTGNNSNTSGNSSNTTANGSIGL